MSAPDMADLFGESDEDDDFTPAERKQNNVSPLAEEEDNDASPSGGVEEAQEDDLVDGGDPDTFRDAPQPHQPSQLRDYSDDDDDDEGIVQTTQERPVGPPAEMSGALLPLPSLAKLRLLQTSKFLGIQTLPMTPENLKLERDGVVLDDVTGEASDYSYKRQMTIRWRERTLPSGEVKIESNARFVKWSNGTTQLLLGEEVLDMAELENTSANQFLFVRHSHPVAFIQGLGQLTKKVQLRPSSLRSKFHRQLAAEATKKHTRVNRVKATATIEDPNKAKAEREKAEEERIRQKENLQRRQEKEMKKYPTASRREYRPVGITPQFLETIEDEPDYSEDEDLTATERARSALQRRPQGEEDEREAELRLARAKQSQGGWRDPSSQKRQRAEPEEQDPEMQDFIVDDDEEEGLGRRPPPKKGRRGGLVLSDDDDE